MKKVLTYLLFIFSFTFLLNAQEVFDGYVLFTPGGAGGGGGNSTTYLMDNDLNSIQTYSAC